MVKKILVIRFSSIGDIILTSPVLRCLKKQDPGREIHVLTKSAYQDLFLHNPNVDKVFALGQETMPELIKALKQERYDYVVDLHRNMRSLRVKMGLRVASSSFPKLNIRKYLLVRFGISMLPDIHIVDRYFQAVRRLGVIADGQGLDFYLDPQTPDQAALLPKDFPKEYFAFVNGGRHQTKIIPIRKAVEICKALNKPVVLLGGPEDSDSGEAIARDCNTLVYNGCGKYSLMESAGILAGAKGVISGDTGLMHLAAALRKPMVTVWGNTIPEFGMYPYMPDAPGKHQAFEIKPLSCRPCSKLGHPSCPEHHFRCMMDQNGQAIASALFRLAGLP